MFPEPTLSESKFASNALQSRDLDPQQLSIEVATNLQEVEALRPIWTAWNRSLESNIDYYLHSLRSDPGIVRPHVIVAYQGGVAQGMLVSLVRKRRISTVVSFVAIRGPKARVLEIIYQGRMGRQSPEIDRILALELFQALERGQADLLCFQRLSLQSELFHQVKLLSGSLIKGRVPHVFNYSLLSLSAAEGNRSTALSGKARREMRRKARNLERELPGRFRFQCFSEPHEMEAGMCDAAKVSVTTWQHYVECNLLDSADAQQRFRFCADQGWLRIFMLYIDERPVAFLIGQLYERTFYCRHTGYNPEFARLSVGSLVTAWAFDQLAAAGVLQIDLGAGGEEHNRRLGCQPSEEGTVHVYSSTLRGFSLNLFFATSQVVRASGRRTRSTLGLSGISKKWKAFLTPSAPMSTDQQDVPTQR